MKGEIPVFRRCCFCLPLRYGLLAWGYFKMTADAILVSIMTYILLQTLDMMRLYGKEDYSGRFDTNMIISIIAITVFFTDFIVTIVFIVGGHKRNVKLIRVFYFFSIGMCVITCLFTAMQVVLSLQFLMEYNTPVWVGIVLPLSFFFVVLAVQGYFLLLLRSEIIKLRKNGEFRCRVPLSRAENLVSLLLPLRRVYDFCPVSILLTSSFFTPVLLPLRRV